MKPIEFEQQTVVYAKDQKEYLPLPAYECKNNTKTIITCWEGNWRDRLKFLFTGKMWVHYLTFGEKITPLVIKTENPFGE